MMKRIFALLLCLVTVLSVFAGCSNANADDEYKGQAITTYLTTNLYDLDPAHTYNNESSANIVGLMFDTLFTLTDDKKVKKSLVKEYTITEDENSGEYEMTIELKEAKWSDGTYVSANDVVFAWKRLLEVENSFEAAALLFDIKNARAAKEGDASIDDVGIYAEGELIVTIKFEEKIDYDQFLLNLTSVALAPLREDIVTKGEDWAKKPATMVCSGPFRLGRVNFARNNSIKYFDPSAVETGVGGVEITGAYAVAQTITDFVLERNAYYYRDPAEDSLFKTVKPYRLCVDCSLTPEQLKVAYEAGVVTYIGDIPLDLRNDDVIKKAVEVEKYSLSTNLIYLNQNVMVDNGTDDGYALFANEKVRQALSLAVDREAIVDKLVYAEVATGLVPTGVFASGSKKSTFRSQCNNEYKYLSYDLEEAEKLISEAKAEIGTPGRYSFEITYPAYDEVHKYVAETIAESWSCLGFKVSAKPLGTIANNDYYKPTDSTPVDICDDLYAEALRAGRFEAIILDYCAISVDPYSLLAPFAKAFSGQGMDMSDTENYKLTPHVTGYDSDEYNKKMEEIFAEKKISDRADGLYEAENILMTDMPVIPIVFNKKATVIAKDLKKTSSNYYVTTVFTKAKLSNYDEYLASGKTFVTDNFENLTFRKSIGNDDMASSNLELAFNTFKTSNTIYAHFFAEEDDE